MSHLNKYACTKTIREIKNSIIKLCFTVNRNSSDSFPTRFPAAAATAIDCGEIILPTTPPEILAATVTTGSTPIVVAVAACSLPNKALEEVSEPVINTPSQPSKGAKKGNKTPVAARVSAMVIVIPESLRI